MFLGTVIYAISRTQSIIALSSGEAELYAIGLGVAEALFLRTFLLESGLFKNVGITIHTDSTAGKSIASRFGLSRKTRHIDIRFLFVQDLIKTGVVKLKKVLGADNVADVLTKYVTHDVLRKLLPRLNLQKVDEVYEFMHSRKFTTKLQHDMAN